MLFHRSILILAAGASVLVLPLPGRAAITNGLVGHWTFNETSGPAAADSSGRGNAAQVANAVGDEPAWVAGKIGNALVFRGPNDGSDYAVAPNLPKLTNTFSVSAWAWADERPTWPQSAIVESGLGSGGPIGLVIRNKNVDQAFGPLGETTTTENGAVNIQDTVGFPVASWQHVAAVADGTLLKLFRNGNLVSTSSYAGAFVIPAGTALGIGAVLDDSGTPVSGFWQGRIDDLGVWTNALSEAQIAAIFTAGQAQKDLANAEAFLVSPPTISAQPKSLNRYVGESARFSVTAAGTAPFSYQWKLNNTEINNATNSSYGIGYVRSSDAGAYTVVVRNSAGSIESASASLAVTPIDFSTGLIGYWTFDESSGDVAADSSAGKHPATLVDFTDDSRWVTGRVGKALQMNGSNGEFAHVSDYEKPVSTMTASAWVWADGRGTWATFVKNWGDVSAGQFHFGLFTDGHENIFIKQADGKTPNVSDPALFPTNSWQHVAFVCDGTLVRLYRNGAEVASVPYDGTLVNPPMNCIGIGTKLADACETRAGSASGPWDGKLDEIGLWKRGLSPQEIYALFKAGEAGKGILEAAGSIPTQAVFTRQPQGATVFENVAVTLSASATGVEPLSYQWMKDGQPLNGATTPVLNLGKVTTANAGKYRLRVTNPQGFVDSDEAVIAVTARPPATLVSEWKFEDNLNDSSGNGNNGTAAGAVAYVPGKFGKAVQLAPGNPVIKESATKLPMSKTNSWSINIWVKLEQEPTSLAYLAGFGPVLNTGAGTGRGLLAFTGAGNNNILFWGNSNDQGSTNRYPTNRWAMITITYAGDDKSVNLFLDGSQIATGIKNLNDVPADSNQISLAPTSNWSIDVGGAFDEFTVWDGMLLASQISALFDPNGGPVNLTAQRVGSKLAISWPGTVQGFVLESTDSLGSSPWSSVAGVTNNRVEVDLNTAHRFYRLRR